MISSQAVPRVSVRSVPWWLQCLGLWLAALVILNLAGLAAVRVLDLREGYDPVIGVPPGSIPGIWARWDSSYYIDLADQGYAALPYAMGYFPLYPILMTGISRLTGMELALSGMLISQASYLAAILLFYKLARLLQDEHAYAMRSVIAMLVFPTAFFFFAVYAESLWLAFSVLSAYLVLRRLPGYALAGLASGIASAARPVGWLLNSVFLVEFIARRKFNLRSLSSLAAGVGLSFAGIAAFVYYLYTLTGSFLAIPESQEPWLRQWQLPWITLAKSIRVAALGNGVPDDWFLYAINLSDLLFTLFAIGLTVVAVRRSRQGRFPWSLSVYLIVSILFLLSTQGVEEVPLWGMTRWVAALFPLYLLMGQLLDRRRLGGLALSGSALAAVLLFAWWATGRWVG